VKAGGIRVLLQTLAEGPAEMTNLLTPVFLYVMDSPKTRNYLMPGSEMEARRDLLFFMVYSLGRLRRLYYLVLWTHTAETTAKPFRGQRICVKPCPRCYVHGVVRLRSLFSYELANRSAPGLIYFCMDDLRAIRALVDTLRIPSLETRVREFAYQPSEQRSLLCFAWKEIILDMFFNLLKIKTPEWYQSFISGRRLTSKLFPN
jgi:rapamycin-insensitive companion of mTOR